MERWNNVPWSVEVSESTQPAETSLPRNRSSRTSAGRTSRTRNSNTSASTLAKFLEFFTFKIIVITVVLIVVFVGVFVVIVLLVSKGSIEEDVFTDENLEKSFTSMVVTSRRTTRVRTTVLTTTRSSTALRNQVGRKLFDKTDHIQCISSFTRTTTNTLTNTLQLTINPLHRRPHPNSQIRHPITDTIYTLTPITPS